DPIAVVRNEAWSQGRAGRRAHLDGILYKIYPEAGQLMDAARAGQVSLALELPDDQLATMADTGAVTVQRRSQLAYEQVTFNQADPNPLTGQSPLWKNDPGLLQALRGAIDRPGLVKQFYADRAGLLERAQVEAGLWTCTTDPDPDGVYPLEHSSEIPTDQNQGQGSNFGHFSNADLDRNLDKGRTSLVMVERARSYAAFERAYAR